MQSAFKLIVMATLCALAYAGGHGGGHGSPSDPGSHGGEGHGNPYLPWVELGEKVAHAGEVGLHHASKEGAKLAAELAKEGPLLSPYTKYVAQRSHNLHKWSEGAKGAAVVLGGVAGYMEGLEKKWDRKDSLINGGSGAFAAFAGAQQPQLMPGWGVALHMASAGAHIVGAPQGAQDALSIGTEIVPATQAGKMMSLSWRAGRRLVQGDMKGFDQVMQNAGEGDSGAVLQGYIKSVDLGVDYLTKRKCGYNMLDAKVRQCHKEDLESAFLKAGSGKGQKESAVGRAGTWLGDQAYKFINQDMPEARYFAYKDYQRGRAYLNNKWNGSKRYFENKWDSAKKKTEEKVEKAKDTYRSFKKWEEKKFEQGKDIAKSAWKKTQEIEREVVDAGRQKLHELARLKERMAAKAQQEADELKASAKRTYESTKQAAEKVYDKASETVSAVYDGAKQKAHAAYDTASDYASSAWKKLSGW